jgi:hypothetical protein
MDGSVMAIPLRFANGAKVAASIVMFAMPMSGPLE